MGDKKGLFSFLKRKKEISMSQSQKKYDDLEFHDNDFFFEDGVKTDFNHIRMNMYGLITLRRIQDFYRTNDPKMTDKYMSGLIYQELERAIDHARETIRERDGENYNPRRDIEFMGGDINTLYNMPGTIESQYKYRVVDILAKYFPTIALNDEPELK